MTIWLKTTSVIDSLLLMAIDCCHNSCSTPLLLDAGAEIDAANEMGQTACYAAIRACQFDALTLLDARGAFIDTSDGSLLAIVAQSGRRDYRMTVFCSTLVCRSTS
jgi:hypothetical protein